MKRGGRLAGVFIAAMLLTAVYVQTAEGEELSWTGCGITKKAFMSEIATAYEAKTGIKVNISGGGATKGIRTVAAATSDLGGTCRHALLDDSGAIVEAEADSLLTQVAWDALVVIVHPDNPVSNITLSDLKDIYNGTITSWKDLGGPDKKIALVTREGKTSGVGHMFRRLVFADEDYEFKARSFKVKSSGPLEKKVEETKTALGVDGVSSARKRTVKILSVDGTAPVKENVASGAYPLFRPLYLALNKNAPAKASALLDFVLSSEGQEIISHQGTVNLEEGKDLNSLWAKKQMHTMP